MGCGASTQQEAVVETPAVPEAPCPVPKVAPQEQPKPEVLPTSPTSTLERWVEGSSEGSSHGGEEKKAVAVKAEHEEGVRELSHRKWLPQYFPPGSFTGQKVSRQFSRLKSYTYSDQATLISLPLLLEPQPACRLTKIVCTLGPACNSEEKIGDLLDGGLSVARFNFSHGGHADHFAVLDRFRRVCKEKGAIAATLLDTKGPEIRTAMLRNHEPIMLSQGQEITVRAVGKDYETWEGYKDESGTKIGLSYAGLCKSVAPGSRILIADGSIVIEVLQILDDVELVGKVLNSKKLGERKNCNLPGVHVDLPVLTEKDINDLQSFCCKHDMDYVAASFVQTGADVAFIRKTLDAVGGQRIKIFSKIENAVGLKNFEEILKVTDGIMVARGDLGMDIPVERVALAQKMMITKCNLAGKAVITATQMLESMITNPTPTRAEMTDVANAVMDGTDCVMLSGETANGAFPVQAVTMMASIATNAELALDPHLRLAFLEHWSPELSWTDNGKFSPALLEAVKKAIHATVYADGKIAAIVTITESGKVAELVHRYRPGYPIIAVTTNEAVARSLCCLSSVHPLLVPSLTTGHQELVTKAVELLRPSLGKALAGRKVAVIRARHQEEGQSASGDEDPVAMQVDTPTDYKEEPLAGAEPMRPERIVAEDATMSLRAVRMPNSAVHGTQLDRPRLTKIVCTLGPACNSEEKISELLDAGLSIARFNFSHGNHVDHKGVLERFRKVRDAKGSFAATLLDTKGPEIRTAMLRNHEPIELEQNQEIIVRAVGADYITWEGYKDETGTKIGLSYAGLCKSLSPGRKILLADGSIVIEVVEILDEFELRGKVLNTKKLGERKNCNLPGVHIDIPVLTDKDIDDLQNFCCRHKMDYVAASFVQTAADVRFIRRILAEGGGSRIKIISKIENAEGLRNFEEILRETDAVMVARGDLGMDIPAERVALAQKMIITKCNLAGKPVITATQMLESMINNPTPTRAEMTDVANAVLDGTDCVMLSGETANGAFPVEAVKIMASIAARAEMALDKRSMEAFILAVSKPPHDLDEEMAPRLAKACFDSNATLVVMISDDGVMARASIRHRTYCPLIVVTTKADVAKHTCDAQGQFPCLVSSIDRADDAIKEGIAMAKKLELYTEGPIVAVRGQVGADSDADPEMIMVWNPEAEG